MGNLIFSILFVLFAVFANAQTAAQKNTQPPLNLLVNGGFESGKAQWVNSGGTFLTTTSSSLLLDGKSSASFDAASSGQYVETALQTIPAGLYNTNCMARIEYKGGSELLTLKVLDGSSNVIASRVFTGAATSKLSLPLNFVCPSSGSLKLRVEATGNAPIVYLDKAHLGETDNLFVGSADVFIGSAFQQENSGCVWTISNTSFSDFPTASCDAITVEKNPGPGVIDTTQTQLPQLKINGLPEGLYEVTVTGSFDCTSGGPCAVRLTDGIATDNPSGAFSANSNNNAASPFTLVRNFEYTSSGNRIFKIQGRSNGGTSVNLATNLPGRELTWSIKRLKSQQQTAFIPETRNWLVEATIGTGCNLSASTVNPATEMNCPSASLVNNTSISNTILAKLACPGTEASTGATCSGDGSNGIVVDIPVAGDIEVCSSFTSIITNTSSGVDGNVQIVRTANSSQTILASALTDVRYGNGTAGGHITHEPLKTCGIFKVPAGTNTFRAFYSQAASGLASNETSVPKWTVKPVGQQIPAPILVGPRVESSNSLNERIERAYVTQNGTGNCTSSPCDASLTSGNWISSVTRISQGAYTVFFATPFADKPICTFAAHVFGGGYPASCTQDLDGGATTTSQMSVICNNTNTNGGVDASFSFICMGPK